MLTRSIIVALWFLMSALPAVAQESLHVGVAANFIQPFKEIAASFEQSTGIKVTSAFTSSGSLYSQAASGAPYDLILSADEERPQMLCDKGFCGTPFVYAKGAVVLFSAKKDLCRLASWRDVVRDASVKKIAIAHTGNAPYGASAMAALKAEGLWEGCQGRLVVAQNIAQSFQYATTEAVDAAFCAKSAALSPDGEKGCTWAVAEAPAIIQGACVLKSTKRPAAAQKFADFLGGKEAKAVLEKYGYR
ncbi:MAG: Molybdate-binding periplasmic protein precursor [Syntrophaceae bacterium PtaU1.Bin231]|nr:MAG: Molybdate-binding periplasmic protein precursor [Syntrophaceae bacterium PtaU1.Bin231]HOG17955.1 molybdate ABC transporter substrate-binding protein [Syntrophales bacterium]